MYCHYESVVKFNVSSVGPSLERNMMFHDEHSDEVPTLETLDYTTYIENTCNRPFHISICICMNTAYAGHYTFISLILELLDSACLRVLIEFSKTSAIVTLFGS